MKKRPILFSGENVRAILAGKKTQTRRVVKPQPPSGHQWSGWCVTSTHRPDEGKATWASDSGPYLRDVHRVACPYGQPGDRLWVRECFAVQPDLWNASHGPQPLHYLADVSDRRQIEDYTVKPSIHMPRWASRIALEITGVRVERLQDISAADAIAEGVGSLPIEARRASSKLDYMAICESINGPGSWDANPWVWVIEFKKLEGDEA